MKPDQVASSWSELVAALADQERLSGADRSRFIGALLRCDPANAATAQRRNILHLGAILCLFSGLLLVAIFHFAGGLAASRWYFGFAILSGVPGYIYLNRRARGFTADHKFSSFAEEWTKYCRRLRPQLMELFPLELTPPPL